MGWSGTAPAGLGIYPEILCRCSWSGGQVTPKLYSILLNLSQTQNTHTHTPDKGGIDAS